MTTFHRLIAYGIPATFLVLALWVAVALFRNREPGEGFWRLLGVIQVVLGVQVIVGGILFLLGNRPSPLGPAWLHYIYGGLFPAGMLMLAHTQARKREQIAFIIFGVACFLNFGLTFRALQTALRWFG